MIRKRCGESKKYQGIRYHPNLCVVLRPRQDEEVLCERWTVAGGGFHLAHLTGDGRRKSGRPGPNPPPRAAPAPGHGGTAFPSFPNNQCPARSGRWLNCVGFFNQCKKVCWNYTNMQSRFTSAVCVLGPPAPHLMRHTALCPSLSSCSGSSVWDNVLQGSKTKEWMAPQWRVTVEIIFTKESRKNESVARPVSCQRWTHWLGRLNSTSIPQQLLLHLNSHPRQAVKSFNLCQAGKIYCR